MAKYLEIAAQANQVAKTLLDLVEEGRKPQAADLIAQLVNLGIRCSPRGVQHTVRFNAVERAVRGLPVIVGMKEVTNPHTGKSYHALTTKPVGGSGMES